MLNHTAKLDCVDRLFIYKFHRGWGGIGKKKKKKEKRIQAMLSFLPECEINKAHERVF